MPISSKDGIAREPTVGITSLSELKIDVSKDWLGYVIKNLGAPVDAGDAVRLPVLRANMEYPLTDVALGYLLSIGKVGEVRAYNGYNEFYGLLTVDSFTDKAVSCFQKDYSGHLCRWVDLNNWYGSWLYSGAATADFQVGKNVGAGWTLLASEAVDLTAHHVWLLKFSLLGTTLKAYREDMVTPKISVTDTSHASGRFGSWAATSQYAWTSLACILLAPSSPSAKALSYFEAPVVGSGTLEDPFRAQMPEEVAWGWSLNPAAKKKYDLLKLKGFTDEEIVTLFPEVLSCKVNRLALTHSCLIKTDKATGKPVEYTAIVRVFEQPDRQAHLRPMLDGITALRGTAGVRELTRDEAVKRAKQIDPDLTDVDLTRVPPTDVNFKTILKDYVRHREGLGVKRELIDDKLMERYLAEEKGW